MEQGDLPRTNTQQVKDLDRQYQEAYNMNSHDLDETRMRFIWALVHSVNREHNARGVKLAQVLEQACQVGHANHREATYFKAVGLFHSGNHIESRRALQKILEIYPTFSQAHTLLQIVEKELVKDGLIGIGVVGGVVVALGTILGMALSGSSRR